MAKNESDTTLLEKDYSDSFFDVIDEKLEQQSQVELEAKKALFDNNHSTEELNKVYDEIDKEQVLEHDVSPIELENPNPFYGDKDALTQLSKKQTYNNTFFEPQEKIATLEIKPKIPTKKTTKISNVDRTNEQILGKRKKLWTCVGCISLVMFFALCIYNFVVIGTTLSSNDELQNNITNAKEDLLTNQEKYERILSELGESSITIAQGAGMTNTDSSTTVDLTPTNVVSQPTAPSGFFDRLCNFFATLFGR